MPVLTNSKHEKFAQAVAKGVTASAAYIAAGYSKASAGSNGARMRENEGVSARIAALQATLSAGTIALEISSRNARVQALQNRWDLLRQVITERAEHYRNGGDDEYDKAIPGGTTGLLVKDYKGKDADTPVYKIDTGALSALLAHEKQAAAELGQWSEKHAVTVKDGLAERLIAARARVAAREKASA
jgi:hypothetical protein